MADSASARFSCTCGKLTGRITPVSPRSGTHIKCYCPDCRAAEVHFGQPDPGQSGVELFQMTPDMINIDQGQEYLGAFRFSPKGIYRWYASCCRAPLFNTLVSPKLPFAGVVVARLEDGADIGPVVAEGHVKQADGSTKHKGGTRLVWGVFRRMGAARLSGKWKETPFFDPSTGDPVVTPEIMSREERARLKASLT